MLRSVDSVSEEDRMHYAYSTKFLQQLNTGGVREPNSVPELSQLLFVQRLTKKTR